MRNRWRAGGPLKRPEGSAPQSRWRFFFFSLCSFSLPSAFGRGSDPARIRSARPGYAAALAAANRFLAAWQAQDRENGLVMLTEAAKPHGSEDRLEEFFSPGADAAYEISRGRKMDGGRYVFPVTLFGAGTGHRGGRGFLR
jgi:hypothetical protein